MADPTYTYDLASDTGKIRLLLNDIPVPSGEGEDPALTAVFFDEELDAFLDLEGTVKRAAAQAIDTNATNEALASKVLRTQDLQTDGAKLADAMRKHAAELRRQDDEDDAASDGFALVSVVRRPGCVPELTEHPVCPPYPGLRDPFC